MPKRHVAKTGWKPTHSLDETQVRFQKFFYDYDGVAGSCNVARRSTDTRSGRASGSNSDNRTSSESVIRRPELRVGARSSSDGGYGNGTGSRQTNGRRKGNGHKKKKSCGCNIL
jgi:hypothetical protein